MQLDSNYNKNLDLPAGVDSIYSHRGGSPRRVNQVVSGATPGSIAQKSESRLTQPSVVTPERRGRKKKCTRRFWVQISTDLIAVRLLYITPMLLNTILKCLTFYLSRTFHVFGWENLLIVTKWNAGSFYVSAMKRIGISILTSQPVIHPYSVAPIQSDTGRPNRRCFDLCGTVIKIKSSQIKSSTSLFHLKEN